MEDREAGAGPREAAPGKFHRERRTCRSTAVNGSALRGGGGNVIRAVGVRVNDAGRMAGLGVAKEGDVLVANGIIPGSPLVTLGSMYVRAVCIEGLPMIIRAFCRTDASSLRYPSSWPCHSRPACRMVRSLRIFQLERRTCVIHVEWIFAGLLRFDRVDGPMHGNISLSLRDGMYVGKENKNWSQTLRLGSIHWKPSCVKERSGGRH